MFCFITEKFGTMEDNKNGRCNRFQKTYDIKKRFGTVSIVPNQPLFVGLIKLMLSVFPWLRKRRA